MPERCDAKLLQVLFRQARKYSLVYLIFAECRLILPEAQAPQPDHNVHEGAHNRGWHASWSRPKRVSRQQVCGRLWQAHLYLFGKTPRPAGACWVVTLAHSILKNVPGRAATKLATSGARMLRKVEEEMLGVRVNPQC